MRTFRNCYTIVARIKGREFFYSEKGNVIRGSYPDLPSLGFINKGKYFEREIDPAEIDSAYKVKWNYGLYKGFKVRVADYREEQGDIYVMFDSDEEGKAAGITPWIDPNDKFGRFYEAYVPESEVTDVYELREAVDGFPFICPEIVYLKKDGVQLPWHEYGTPLQDNEWI